MRISLKVIAAVCTLIALGIALQAYLHSQRLRELHNREQHDDLRLVARALANATAELWKHAGPDAARSYIESADLRRSDHAVSLIEPVGGNGVESPDARGEQVKAKPRLLARSGVVVDGQEIAIVVVARASATVAPYLSEARRTQVTTAVLLISATIMVVLLVVSYAVGRPVARLVEQAERIGEGDFAPAPVSSHDELGQLARAMNDMATKLDAAQSRLLTQRRRHANALEELRHADRLSTVGKLASSIAHEMGTPLNVILGRASMLAGEVDDGAKTNVAIIQEQATRLHDVIQQLMQYARKEKVEAASTPLPDVVAHACTLVAPLAEDKGVEIHLDVNIDSDAHLDAGQTLQVLTNLMVNGVQAMKGGGSLAVSGSELHVENPPEKRARPGAFVRLRVKDNGPGMEPEVLDQIFEPFFTTKKSGKGTGLGLSVCHGIVREAGGWIDVESAPGTGTTFDVYLPKETGS